MHIRFTYDPTKEIIPLQRALTGIHNPSPTSFDLAAQAATISLSSPEEVTAFALTTIECEHIPVDQLVAQFSSAWNPFNDVVTQVLKQGFETEWDPGEITAYLTLNQRCPYNVTKRYFFVSMTRRPASPLRTSLHELQHFYTHTILEPYFVRTEATELFEDFKEALTVLINYQFAPALEAPDTGYPQHQQLRAWITDQYENGLSIRAICEEYIGLMTAPL